MIYNNTLSKFRKNNRRYDLSLPIVPSIFPSSKAKYAKVVSSEENVVIEEKLWKDILFRQLNKIIFSEVLPVANELQCDWLIWEIFSAGVSEEEGGTTTQSARF